MEVGNGANIRIWGDKWIPTTSTYEVVSPKQFLHSDTRVNELINLETGSQKSDIIDALFLPFEADIIKSIPISGRLPADKQLWVESFNGLFNVRIAYAEAMKASWTENRGASSDDSRQWQFWKQIWCLPDPHKLRHFAWRAYCDSLPTKVNLQKQKVVQDDYCDECILEVKLNQHLFWTCLKAKETLAAAKMVASMSASHCQKFQDLLWLMVIEDQTEVDRVSRVVAIAWALWHNRNEV